MIEELGAGGMATVYRARDRELRRDVAIKVLFPHLCKNREVVARFHREARAAAGLDHPHILRVFDVGGGADGGGDPPFIVLELVRGPSLDQLVDKGALLAEFAAAVGTVLSSALAHAHKAGVIHRDIKPANLLVAEGGRLVLADFGVARIAEEDASLITRTGALLGTPAFMSPEQATGASLDARSDLYSVGATLYQLATGSLPVTGNPARAVAAIVSGEVVPPLRRNPAMGRELARLIERLMAIDPAGRIASADELQAELRAVVEASGAGEPEALLEEFFADRVACEARVVPIAVASSIERAREALAAGNAARALALCDRALALDAGCREATEIVESIGRRQWVKRAAVVVLVAALLGGAGYGVWKMIPEEEEARPVAAVETEVVFDAAAARVEETTPVESDAAPPERAKQDAGDRVPGTGDRKSRRSKSQPEPRPVAIDAGHETSPVVEPVKEADATLTIAMDAWCNLVIDGEAKGQITTSRTLTVRPGRLALSCANSELGTWKQTVELAPGEKKTLKGTLVGPPFEVKVDVRGGDAVKIGKQRVANGGRLKLKRGQHRVDILRGDEVVGGGWLGLFRACTIQDRPVFGCK